MYAIRSYYGSREVDALTGRLGGTEKGLGGYAHTRCLRDSVVVSEFRIPAQAARLFDGGRVDTLVAFPEFGRQVGDP